MLQAKQYIAPPDKATRGHHNEKKKYEDSRLGRHFAI